MTPAAVMHPKHRHKAKRKKHKTEAMVHGIVAQEFLSVEAIGFIEVKLGFMSKFTYCTVPVHFIRLLMPQFSGIQRQTIPVWFLECKHGEFMVKFFAGQIENFPLFFLPFSESPTYGVD